MKFFDLLASLAVATREPLADFAELARSVREGCEKLGPEDVRLLRAAGVDGVGLRKAFRSRKGPGGGAKATPLGVGFFLTAYLADVPRRLAVTTAVDMMIAKFGPPCWAQDQEHCQVTGARSFGTALAAVLADRGIFERAEVVRISADAGFARIEFDGGVESTFWRRGSAGLNKPCFRERVLLLDGVRFLFDELHAAERAETAMA